MTDGEVAVTQNGHTHVIEADAIDGVVHVDVDRHQATIPSEFGVGYSEDAVADGGTGTATHSQMTGFSMSETAVKWAAAGGGLGLLSAGWMLSQLDGGAGFIAAAVSAGLLYVAFRSYGTGYQPLTQEATSE